MNREIKFRAWYKGEMFAHVEHTTFSDGSNGVTALANGILFSPNSNEVTLMQFTGLKDKNGKEIYEGDIVKVKECECIGQSADGSEEEWIECEGEVFFEDGMFVFEGHSAGTLPLYAYKDDLEIIGNIYETPESQNKGI